MLLLITTQALAARPFVTDDARLTTAGSCQLESWSRHYQHSIELWALPACNPFGNFEITAGAALSRYDGVQKNHDYLLQAKTLFKPLETNGWGIGFALGTVKHPDITPGPNQFGNTYAYIPYSVSFADDQLIMHVNVGMLHDKASNQNHTTWGIGSEITVSPRLIGILETYGDDKDKPYAQIGLRYSIIPNAMQIDTTFGQQVNSDHANQWVSVGIRLTPERIF